MLIYLKRLDFNNLTRPIWHGGFNLEDPVPDDEPYRSVHIYHARVRPHERADLIVEMPEQGHILPQGPFDRDLCFDPIARMDDPSVETR